MDMSNLSTAMTPPSPKSRRRASDFVEKLKWQMQWIEHQKKPEESVRMFYGGAFGVMRAIRVATDGEDFLRVVVADSDKKAFSIIAPVSECSFMFSVFVPTKEEPAEPRAILGFAEDEKAQPQSN